MFIGQSLSPLHFLRQNFVGPPLVQCDTPLGPGKPQNLVSSQTSLIEQSELLVQLCVEEGAEEGIAGWIVGKKEGFGNSEVITVLGKDLGIACLPR